MQTIKQALNETINHKNWEIKLHKIKTHTYMLEVENEEKRQISSH